MRHRNQERQQQAFRVAPVDKGMPNVTDRIVIVHDTERPRAPIALGTNATRISKRAWTGEWANFTPEKAVEVGRALIQWGREFQQEKKRARRKKRG